MVSACTQPAPPVPPAPPAAPKPGYGSVMADVGRRFELVGKAAAAGRFELARYELGEIGEDFTESLPRAAPPKEGTPSALPPLEAEFTKSHLPTLARALDADGGADVAPAFAKVAEACNECHRASGHGFVEVPTVPGQSVPDVSPLAGQPAR
jgi:hypothetical protein